MTHAMAGNQPESSFPPSHHGRRRHQAGNLEAAGRTRVRFDRRSRAAIAAAGTDLPTVLAALHGGHPKMRRHLGSGRLRLYASTPDGQWLVMTLVETHTDEEWLLTDVCHGPRQAAG